jgi:hypothetical protein
MDSLYYPSKLAVLARTEPPTLMFRSKMFRSFRCDQIHHRRTRQCCTDSWSDGIQ